MGKTIEFSFLIDSLWNEFTQRKKIESPKEKCIHVRKSNELCVTLVKI